MAYENPIYNSRVAIDRLEENFRDVFYNFDLLTARVQRLDEDTAIEQLQAGQQNFLANGDFDWNRNRYFYETDYEAIDTREAADVSEEAAFWFTHGRDTAKEVFTGGVIDIGVSDTTLTIPSGGDVFVDPDDVDTEIVIEGALSGGGDLVTTIASWTSATVVELTDPADTSVTDARVRWNLQELKEDSTDVDYGTGESTPSLIGIIHPSAIRTVTADYTIGTIIGENLTILADATGGAFTVTLPDATKVSPYLITVKKIDSTTEKVTIEDGANNIDGALTQVISTQYNSLTMQSDGTEYWII